MAHANFGDPRLPERFWSKAIPEPNSGCWLWLAGSSAGYGTFSIKVAGRAIRDGNAHKAAYLVLRGPVPYGMVLDHLCRVTCCVNPAHLEIVTNEENVLRAWRHRRTA